MYSRLCKSEVLINDDSISFKILKGKLEKNTAFSTVLHKIRHAQAASAVWASPAIEGDPRRALQALGMTDTDILLEKSVFFFSLPLKELTLSVPKRIVGCFCLETMLLHSIDYFFHVASLFLVELKVPFFFLTFGGYLSLHI